MPAGLLPPGLGQIDAGAIHAETGQDYTPPPQAAGDTGLDSGVSQAADPSTAHQHTEYWLSRTHYLETDPNAWQEFLGRLPQGRAISTSDYDKLSDPEKQFYRSQAEALREQAARSANLNLNAAMNQEQKVAAGGARPLTPLQQKQLDDLNEVGNQRTKNQQQFGLSITDAQARELIQNQQGNQLRAASLAEQSAHNRATEENATVNTYLRQRYNEIQAQYRQDQKDGKSVDQAIRTAGLQLAALKSWYDQASRWQSQTVIQPFEHTKTLAEQEFHTTMQDAAAQDSHNLNLYNTQYGGAVRQRNNDADNARAGGTALLRAYVSLAEKAGPVGINERMLEAIRPWAAKHGIPLPKEWQGSSSDSQQYAGGGAPQAADFAGGRSGFDFSGQGVGPDPNAPAPTQTRRQGGYQGQVVNMPSGPIEAQMLGMQGYYDMAPPWVGPQNPQPMGMAPRPGAPNIYQLPPDQVGAPPSPMNVPAEVAAYAQSQYPGISYDGANEQMNFGDSSQQNYPASMYSVTPPDFGASGLPGEQDPFDEGW